VILNILILLAGVLSIIMAIIVLVGGTNTKSMRIAYGMFAGSVGMWAIFLGLFLVITSNELARISVFTYYSLGLLIPYSFLFFSLAYLSIPVSRFVRFFALLPWIAMSVLIAVPGGMYSAIDASSAKTVELIFSTYLLYSAVFVLYVALGLWLLITKAARARGVLRHRRIVAVSLLVGFAGGGYFDIILPLFNNYELIAYGPLFAFVTSVGIFYVIARHGLFDVRLAVVRTVSYLLALATLAALYYALALAISNLFLRDYTLVQPAGIGLAIVLAFVFQPVRRFFDHFTNAIFYKDGYNADDFYAKLNKVLTSTTDLRTLLKRASNTITETFKSEQASFFVYMTDGRFVSDGTDGHRKVPYSDAESLRVYTDIITPDLRGVSRSTHKLLVSHKLGLVMPLIREGNVIGFFCLGDHKTSTYSRRDKRVLRTIADELVIAIQNALSIEEVKVLNATLQQRIDSATKELRASNAQLQRLDEAKDEFISMASHQLRTPLTSIKGYISMLVEGDVGKVSPQQKHLLDEAFLSSERMVRLIGDFLNVSRLQTGKFIIDKHPINLAKVVAQELESLLPNAAARGQKFTYKEPKNFPELNLDESKFRQVIMNFADNAIYYSKDNSTIKVSLSVEGKEVMFTVKDTGIGVPIKEQDQLFGKFFRATNARKQRPDGTGVGLFLAKKVIDAHDGKTIFESKEGKGSTFGFRIPIPKS